MKKFIMFVFAFAVTAAHAAPPRPLQLTVSVTGASLPSTGDTGVDVFLYRKSDGKIQAKLRSSFKNTGQPVDLPFTFKEGASANFGIKVYAATLGDLQPKQVGFKAVALTDSESLSVAMALRPSR